MIATRGGNSPLNGGRNGWGWWVKGNERGPWLEELSAEIRREIRGNVSWGVDLGEEAEAVGRGIELVEGLLDLYSLKLEEG